MYGVSVCNSHWSMFGSNTKKHSKHHMINGIAISKRKYVEGLFGSSLRRITVPTV